MFMNLGQHTYRAASRPKRRSRQRRSEDFDSVFACQRFDSALVLNSLSATRKGKIFGEVLETAWCDDSQYVRRDVLKILECMNGTTRCEDRTSCPVKASLAINLEGKLAL